MEKNEFEQRKIEIAHSDEQVPETLLANVLARLEQRQTYLHSDHSTQLAGLTDPAWEIRSAALQALDSSNTSDMLQYVLPALKDEHRLVRVTALRMLSHADQKIVPEYLLNALNDNEWEVREMAVLCLSELSRQEIDLMGALLRVAQHDPQFTVRDAAQYALNKHESNHASHDHPTWPATSTQTEKNTTLAPGLHLLKKVYGAGMHYGTILNRQAALIHPSIWLGAFCITLLASTLTCIGMFHKHVSLNDLPQALSYLILFICISAAAGTAFLCGGENDPALELTIATPTSMRLIVLFRFALVLGYNLLLALCASLVIALLNGGGLWEMIQLWLGPMVLIASLTFSISLLLGSWISLLISFITTAVHILSFNMHQLLPGIDLSTSGYWQVQPFMFGGALLLLIVAIYYAPHQPQLETS